MLYVKFNKDGSVNELSITESINQGNHNVNKIFATFVEMPLSDPTVHAEFELPDHSVVTLGSISSSTYENESGYDIYIPNTVTKYAGTIKFHLSLKKTNNTLYTQQVSLVVNKTPYVYEDEEE